MTAPVTPHDVIRTDRCGNCPLCLVIARHNYCNHPMRPRDLNRVELDSAPETCPLRRRPVVVEFG